MGIKKNLGWLAKPWQFIIKKLRLNTPRRKMVFGGIFLLFFSIIYLLISLLNVSKAEVALAELEKSFKEEAICHEECYLWRQGKEKIVELGLKDGNTKLENRILVYWRDSEENFEFKKEFIQIMLATYGKNSPPAYLSDYLANPDANQRLIREIVSGFDLGATDNQSLLVRLNDEIKKAATSTEKIEAIKTLGEVDGGSEIANYFLLLNSVEDVKVKKQAIKNISNILEKSKYFTLEQLTIIKSLVLAPETNSSLRQDLVLLLGDYYLVYPEESKVIWDDAYKNESLDSISRLFSADNLNHLAGEKLELPAVSSEEWADYYNQ
jgi:hypothetical protein